MIPKAQNRVVQGATYLSELVESKHEFSFWCRTKSQCRYSHSSEKRRPVLSTADQTYVRSRKQKYASSTRPFHSVRISFK